MASGDRQQVHLDHPVAPGETGRRFCARAVGVYLLAVSVGWIAIAVLKFLRVPSLDHPWWESAMLCVIELALGVTAAVAGAGSLARRVVGAEFLAWFGLFAALWASVFVILGSRAYLVPAVLSAGLLLVALVVRTATGRRPQTPVSGDVPYKDPFRGPSDLPEIEAPDTAHSRFPADQGKWQWPS